MRVCEVQPDAIANEGAADADLALEPGEIGLKGEKSAPVVADDVSPLAPYETAEFVHDHPSHHETPADDQVDIGIDGLDQGWSFLFTNVSRKSFIIALVLAVTFYAGLVFVIFRFFMAPPHTHAGLMLAAGDGAQPGSIDPDDDANINTNPTLPAEMKILPPLPPPTAAPLSAQQATPPESFPNASAPSTLEPADDSFVIAPGLISSNDGLPNFHPKREAIAGPTTQSPQVAPTTQPVTPPSTVAIASATPATPVQASADPSAGAKATNAKPHVRTGAKPKGGGGLGGFFGGLDSRGLPRPDYPDESFRRGEAGRVEILVGVRPDGSIAYAKVAADNGHPRLAEAALEAARRSHLIPATEDGKPVSDEIVIPYIFTLTLH